MLGVKICSHLLAFKKFHQVVVIVGSDEGDGEGCCLSFKKLVMGDLPPIGFPHGVRVKFPEDLEHIQCVIRHLIKLVVGWYKYKYSHCT